MGRFVVYRLLNMVPLILGITLLSFLVMSLAPGDYLSSLKLNPAISPAVVHQMEAEFGLNQPLIVRYLKWLWAVMHLDLGVSLAYRVSVTKLIAARALNTVILALASMVFSWVLAIPLGIAAAARQNTVWDRLLSFFAFLGMSVPSFFLAFLLVYLALRTGWFPVGGSFSVFYSSLSPGMKIVDRFDHLVLPVVVLGTAGLASLMRLMRSQILELKNSDFARTAHAKGLSPRAVLYKHVLRNALNPFITLAGYGLADLLGGAALIEAVMNLQGLGLLLLDAVRSFDVYLVMGSVLMGTVLLLVGNLIADVALVLVDPRVSFWSARAR